MLQRYEGTNVKGTSENSCQPLDSSYHVFLQLPNLYTDRIAEFVLFFLSIGSNSVPLRTAHSFLIFEKNTVHTLFLAIAENLISSGLSFRL